MKSGAEQQPVSAAAFSRVGVNNKASDDSVLLIAAL